MVNWQQLVNERDAWIAHNFPDQKAQGSPATETVMGCVEEVGELAHAHLKELQGIRGTAEEHQANAKDSIGDLCVYLLGVMSHLGYVPSNGTTTVSTIDNTDQCVLLLAGHVGKLAKGTVRAHSVFAIQGSVDMIAHYARRYCELRGWDFDAIVQGTWDAVKERDWIAYPDTGRPPEQGDFGLREGFKVPYSSYARQALAATDFLYPREGETLKLTNMDSLGIQDGDYMVDSVLDGTIVVHKL